jgi:GT2 family glycosyltransferase
MKIAAGYVLFQPDVERFKVGLDIVLRQFDEVIAFDNVGDNESLFDGMDNVVYITENANKGIAYGLNRIMEQAKKMQYEWVVTLDQDTVIPEDMATRFSSFVHLENVAIISPQVIDKRRKYMQLNECQEDVIDIDFCSTTASCTNIGVWNKLGGFDELLFIDFVDNDYCKRAKLAGYRILQIPSLVIDQQFGNITLKSPWKVKFYLWLSKVTKNKNVAKLSYHKEVSPVRIYYVHRNLIYLNKKFKESGGIGYSNFFCKSFAGFLLYFTLPSIVRGKKKIKILKAVVKGLTDGIELTKS